jgi:hypothetical protein
LSISIFQPNAKLYHAHDRNKSSNKNLQIVEPDYVYICGVIGNSLAPHAGVEAKVFSTGIALQHTANVFLFILKSVWVTGYPGLNTLASALA